MAKPSEKDREYIERAEKMLWPDLETLWAAIKNDDTPGWQSGKALEHLVIRAFRLSGLEAEYPYDVPPGGNPIEQIDGFAMMDSLVFLVECKDKESVDIEAIAKLRNQLLRRPETTMGCVFAAGDFTSPALIITDFSVPHRILLWSEVDIDNCVRKRDFKLALRQKYIFLCKYGLTDHSPTYKENQT